MSTINHFYRSAFSERLCAALDGKGLPSKSPSRVTKAFNAASGIEPLTQQAVRKWLVGEAIPSQEKLVALSRWLGVSAEWLSFGTGGPTSTTRGEVQSVNPQKKLLVVAPEHIQLVPLVNRLAQLDSRDLALIEGLVRLMLEKKGET